MENLEIYNNYKKAPAEALKPITGGRISGMTDINPMWRIKALTEQFGACGFGWYYKATNKWLEAGPEGSISAFVDIELFINVDGKWSMPICGTGGSSFVAKEQAGLRMSDECFKMATTDAISVACKQLGFGADVYWDKDRTKYDGQQEQKTKNNEVKPTEEFKPKDKITEAQKTVIRNLLKDLKLSAAAVFPKKPELDFTNEEFGTAMHGLQEYQEKMKKKEGTKN